MKRSTFTFGPPGMDVSHAVLCFGAGLNADCISLFVITGNC